MLASTLLVGVTERVDAQRPTKTSDESLLLNEIPTVFGASRFDQAVTDAPASVSIITADDIAAYGWRTLAELMRTVRGFYVTNDRTYSYVGTRGFARPRDYNTRILLLVDGVRVNENVFDGAYVGFESLVDLSSVERVEVIRGPASSVYGANALFGIINVVTVRGRAVSGARISVDVGSFGSRELAANAGRRLASGLELYAAIGHRQSHGQDLYFREFDTPSTNHGMAVGRDGETRRRFFGKAEWGPIALESTINLRDKVMPTAAYETLFNQGRLAYTDNLRNVMLRFRPTGTDRSRISGSLVLNRYDYDGVYPYDSSTTVDWAHGRWAVAELQYSRRVRSAHRLVIGGAYTRNWRQDQGLGVVGEQPDFTDNTRSDTRGVFALTEIRLRPRLLLNGGVRYDHSARIGDNLHPRAGVIYTFGTGSAAKALYGSAFRAPNNYERFYGDGGVTQKANPGLTPELVTTSELLIEHVLSRHVKMTATVYRYEAKQLIDLVVDPTDGLLQFGNRGRGRGEGFESEVELDLTAFKARGGYALQRAWDPAKGEPLSNSPQHIGNLNATAPIAGDRLQLGVEVRALSARRSTRGDAVAGHVVSNVVLSSRRLLPKLDLSVGVFNALNARYADPVSAEHAQRAITQDGRSLRVSAAFVF